MIAILIEVKALGMHECWVCCGAESESVCCKGIGGVLVWALVGLYRSFFVKFFFI